MRCKELNIERLIFMTEVEKSFQQSGASDVEGMIDSDTPYTKQGGSFRRVSPLKQHNHEMQELNKRIEDLKDNGGSPREIGFLIQLAEEKASQRP